MNLIKVLQEDHRAVRASMEAFEHRLGEPAWPEEPPPGRGELERLLSRLRQTLGRHERLEDRLLSPLLAQPAVGGLELDRVLAESRRSFEESQRWLEVACALDRSSAYRMRRLLALLSDDLKRHLDYEEQIVFGLLRERLSSALLEELGRRALPARA